MLVGHRGLVIGSMFGLALWPSLDVLNPEKARYTHGQSESGSQQDKLIGCSSGGTANHLVSIEKSLVQVAPPCCILKCPWVSEILNPKLLLMSRWNLAWQPPPSAYESVVKRFEWSLDWKSAIEMQLHLPFHLIIVVCVTVGIRGWNDTLVLHCTYPNLVARCRYSEKNCWQCVYLTSDVF